MQGTTIQNTLRAFVNRVLRKVFCLKKEKLTRVQER